MKNNYTHLIYKERQLMAHWYNEGLGFREIGRRLNRHHTTISREFARNKHHCEKVYYPFTANWTAHCRRRDSVNRYRLKTRSLRRYIHDKLTIGWTPELIAGRLKQSTTLPNISHEAIYQYIYICAPALYEMLPRKHKTRKKKNKYRVKGSKIPNRQPLSMRADDINQRHCFGHWESDSVISSDRIAALNVLVERKSRLTHIRKMKQKTAELTSQAITKRLSRHPQQAVQSITYDNGSENTKHQSVNDALDAQSFFCAPYHSWEKGSVEQVNGLIRRFLPKGTNFNTISHTQINQIEKLLNNRPRKCLDFKTPYEAFREHCGALTG